MLINLFFSHWSVFCGLIYKAPARDPKMKRKKCFFFSLPYIPFCTLKLVLFFPFLWGHKHFPALKLRMFIKKETRLQRKKLFGRGVSVAGGGNGTRCLTGGVRSNLDSATSVLELWLRKEGRLSKTLAPYKGLWGVAAGLGVSWDFCWVVSEPALVMSLNFYQPSEHTSIWWFTENLPHATWFTTGAFSDRV